MNWQKEDLKYIWHPCSQMKDYETLPPIVVERGNGINLYDTNGKCYKDVISSWWCNLLGHCNSRINNAVKNQIDSLEHVVTSGANGNYGGLRFVCSHHDANCRKLRSDLVLCHGVATAAALPLGNLVQGNAERFGSESCFAIKLFCLRSQGAAGIILKNHSYFLSV